MACPSHYNHIFGNFVRSPLPRHRTAITLGTGLPYFCGFAALLLVGKKN